jgi:hypothetical protein
MSRPNTKKRTSVSLPRVKRSMLDFSQGCTDRTPARDAATRTLRFSEVSP